MSPSHGPPERAVRLLEATLPAVDQGPILGDLHEVYLRRVDEVGRVRARWWYWRQALSFSASFTLERLRDDETGRWEMWSMAEGSVRELALAVRNLWRTPGFTAITVGTLALAIGANTAIFSVIDKVLLEPLPFPDADRIVVLRGTAPGSDLPEEFGLGTEFYVQYRENATTLADLALLSEGQGTVSYGDHVDRLFGAAASPSLYSVLGVQPILGRLPTEEDPEGTVGVLSYWLWQEWFGGDPSALGEAVHALGTDVTIVGIMGPDFQFPEERTSLWVHDLPTPPIRPGGLGLTLVGRLAPDATPETLARELSTLTQRLPERFGGPPQYAALIRQMRPLVRSMEEQLTGPIQTPLWILLGTVSIVLLIACANVANLLIVRAESRRMDLAVRRALGAGRATLIRWQMAEALVLALVGGGLGLLLAWLGVPLLVRAAPEGIPRLSRVGLDGTAFLFTGGVVLLAATLPGCCPPSGSPTRGWSGASGRRGGPDAGRTTFCVTAWW